MQRTVFYSWQSQSPGATNRNFIENALNNVVKRISGDKSINFEISVDRDTAGLPGSPDIANAIFGKIDKADVFIADVTIVNSEHEGRKTPNPNVLLELGYAINALGFDRILMVFNEAYGKVEELPFDLRGKRIMTYKAVAGEADRSVNRVSLEKQLDNAIRLFFLQHSNNVEVIQSPAFQAIESQSPKRHIVVKAELLEIFRKLVELEPAKKAGGGRVDNLYAALDDTIPYYIQFARLAELAVLMDDDAVLKVIYLWFGNLFERTSRLSDYSGVTYDEDFDYFRFLCHEFMVTFVSYLLNAQQLTRLVSFLKTPIAVKYLRDENGPGEVYYYFAAQWTHLLWAQKEKVQKHSPHGYLLKQRHGREDVAEIMPFGDFIVADYFLFLYDNLVHLRSTPTFYQWVDWTAPSLNEAPLFLKSLERIDAANEFIQLLHLETIEQLREQIEDITLKLSSKFQSGRLDLFLRSFDFKKIGTKK